MPLPTLSLRANAFIYVGKLITGSLVVVTEPALDLAKRNYRARVFNTVNGTIGAGLAPYRVLEAMTGSTVALLQTVVYAWLLARRKAARRIGP
ncbi:MAG: hypothetical protein U1F15_09605 [Burkholderiales bacterium]